MINTVILAVAISIFTYLALSKWSRASVNWKATVTPLASIMGSGFLVSMPLITGAVGLWAPVFMALLLMVAYLIGSAIRYNIRYFEPIEHKRGAAQTVAFLSRIVLACAYFISVAYYLQLLAAFLLSSFGLESAMLGNVFTSTLLLSIGAVGILRGLKTLEAVEGYAVSLNLGMIVALIAALTWFNLRAFVDGEWSLPAMDSHLKWVDLRVVLGLLIVVQGFETSRYIGQSHPPEQRIATMRFAQGISSVIYLIFICLALVLYRADLGADVTAIIEMTKPVAFLLPFLIIVAAVGSQFSAAVADNAGAGGLIGDISNNRIPPKFAYLLILVVTITLTWVTHVNEIIAVASRAFALFYFLQCVVALLVARARDDCRALHKISFSISAVLSLSVFVFGIPAE